MNNLLNLTRKKWTVLFLLCTAVTILMGCSVKQKETESPSAPSVTPTLTETPTEIPVPTETQIPTDSPDNSQAIDTINGKKLNAMLPIIDTIVYWNALDPEVAETGINQYKPESDEYVWSLLYLALVNHAEPGQNGVELKGDSSGLQVPASLVQEYASALFSGLESLPVIPTTSGIEYDSSLDAYVLGLSDRGEGFTTIDNYTQDSEGSYIIDATFTNPYQADYTPWRCSLRIVKNTYSPNGQKPLFAYAVTELLP